MDQASVRLSVPSDIEEILPQCSEVELRTLREMYNDSPESLLRIAVYSNQRPYTGLIENKPVCMFGAYSLTVLSDEIYVWLLGSRALREYPMLFVKHCKPVFDYLTTGKQVVKTSVDTRNPRALRLAKFLKLQLVTQDGWIGAVEMRRH